MPADPWAFMRRWCAPVRGRLWLHVDHAGFSDHDRDEYASIEVELPKFEEDAMSKRLDGIRDALVLLAMVARADREAWCHVLEQFWRLKWYEVLKLDGTDAFDRARFHVTFSLSSPEHGWVADMLANLFSGLSAPPSAAFLRAMKKIGALRTCSRTHGAQVEILVSITLYSHDYYRMRREHIGEQPQMERAWSVMKALRSKYGGWRFPVCLSAPTKAGKATIDQSDWLAECVFAIGPVTVNVGTHNREVNTWLARHLAGVADTCNGGEFSSFELRMKFPCKHDAAANAAQDIQTLGYMFEKILCASSKSEESCPTVKKVNVNMKDSDEAGLARVCSALAEARTTTECSMTLPLLWGDPEARTRMWWWLTYAFFSKHARIFSSVTSVSLSRVSLTEEDASTIAAVMASDDSVSLICAEELSTDRHNQSGEATRQVNVPTFAKLQRGAEVTLLSMRPMTRFPLNRRAGRCCRKWAVCKCWGQSTRTMVTA